MLSTLRASRAAALLLALALTAGTTTAAARSDTHAKAGAAPVWDARAAEHLLNRAGFGGTRAEIDALVAIGRDAAIERFFPDPSSTPPPKILAQTSLHGGLASPEDRHATVDARREGYSQLQPDLLVPLNRFGDWWIERMLRGDDALRDHMTIFWHGHFVSSIKEVGKAQKMITQIRFLRDNALGPFGNLVRGIGRDPAMLVYLDNASNVKDHPNENWARELMELFTLGDGNYTETDIKQSSRAFTGWSEEDGHFVNHRLDHDIGEKTVLGVTGNLDGDDVIAILLEQPACGRFLAKKLITYFEGVPPSAARIEDYAAYLRANDYHIGKMLRRLFADPEFYRDEVVGTRVTGPIEYLVGTARRLQIEPPGQMILTSGAVLGQRLFWPPSVKGWEGGMTWITTASLMHRSNMAGVMLGLIDIDRLLQDVEFEERKQGSGAADAAMNASSESPGKMSETPAAMEKTDKPVKSRSASFNLLDYIQQTGWRPELSLATRLRKEVGVVSDAAVVERLLSDLLAVEPSPATAGDLVRFLRDARQRAGLDERALLDDELVAEPLVRRLAHLILSLPEAQLN